MTTMKFLAQKRRSIRKYTSEKLSSEDITEILETALIAPTAKNTRSVRFVLVDDPEMLEALSRVKAKNGTFVKGAALAIAVCADKSVASRPYTDAAIAAAYIQLTAAELELGSCWSHIHETETEEGGDAEAGVRRLLGLPESYGVLCLIAIGVPADPALLATKERVTEWERVYVGRYAARSGSGEEGCPYEYE